MTLTDVLLALVVFLLGYQCFQLGYISGSLDDVNEVLRRPGGR